MLRAMMLLPLLLSCRYSACFADAAAEARWRQRMRERSALLPQPASHPPALTCPASSFHSIDHRSISPDRLVVRRH